LDQTLMSAKCRTDSLWDKRPDTVNCEHKVYQVYGAVNKKLEAESTWSQHQMSGHRSPRHTVLRSHLPSGVCAVLQNKKLMGCTLRGTGAIILSLL
jgi:hypothetical protein